MRFSRSGDGLPVLDVYDAEVGLLDNACMVPLRCESR